MATKRPFSDVGGEDGAAANGGQFAPPRGPKKWKPNHHHHAHAHGAVDGGGSGGNGPAKKFLQKRVRDLKRLLTNEKLPATRRQELELELQGLQAQRADKKVKTHRADMIRRYHMVRFFERQRATRRLKYFNKALADAQTPEEKARLEQDVRMSEVDIAYTQYHPHHEAYVSMWPNNKDDKNKDNEQDAPQATGDPKRPAAPKARQSEDPTTRPEMWQVIRGIMEEEEDEKERTAALEKLRERKDSAKSLVKTLAFHGPKPSGANSVPVRAPEDRKPKSEGGKPNHKKKNELKDTKRQKYDNQRTGHWQEGLDEEEEDDGEGFFE